MAYITTETAFVERFYELSEELQGLYDSVKLASEDRGLFPDYSIIRQRVDGFAGVALKNRLQDLVDAGVLQYVETPGNARDYYVPVEEMTDFIHDGLDSYRAEVRQSLEHLVEEMTLRHDQALEKLLNDLTAPDQYSADTLDRHRHLPYEASKYREALRFSGHVLEGDDTGFIVSRTLEVLKRYLVEFATFTDSDGLDNDDPRGKRHFFRALHRVVRRLAHRAEKLRSAGVDIPQRESFGYTFTFDLRQMI